MKTSCRKTLILDTRKLRDICRGRYLLTSDLADMTGLSVRNVNRIVYSDNDVSVNLRTGYRIAQALNMPVDSIINRTESGGKAI